MKTVKERVDRILRDKVGALLVIFQAEREEDLAELTRLEQEVEFQEGEKKKILEEQKGLNMVREADKKRSFQIGLDVRSIDQTLRNSKSQINDLISRLTSIPDFEESSEVLNFLLVVTAKGFRPNGGELPKSKG